MRPARWTFTAAGIYGLVLLTPLLFVERNVAAPAAGLAHPEYFYGFLLVAIAFQFLFLMIGQDPVRLRPAMIAGVIEKLPFGVTGILLWLQGRSQAPVAILAAVDLAWGLLFLAVWRTTPKT